MAAMVIAGSPMPISLPNSGQGMDAKPRFGIIVDGKSTGSELAPAFLRYGILCVHVESNIELRERRPPLRESDYVAHLTHAGDLAATAAALRHFTPEFVLAGCEDGVLLADALAEELQLSGNGTRRSLARRNKALLTEVLQEKGLLAVPSYVASTADQAASLAQSLGEWPVVVKPIDSSATDGLAFCDDAGAVRVAASQLLGRINFMQSRNDQVLLQRRMQGPQYFALSVSRDGKHHIIELWSDQRERVPGGGVVPSLDRLLPLCGELQERLHRYICDCLDALEIRIGPSYLEIILTSDGPVVVDLAARLMGTQNCQLMEQACGVSQLQLTVACYAAPAEFAALVARPPRRDQSVWIVWLRSRRLGRLASDSWRTRITSLRSYRGMLGTPALGDVLRPTIDEATMYGLVYLVADDEAAVARDAATLQALIESAQLFELEPASMLPLLGEELTQKLGAHLE